MTEKCFGCEIELGDEFQLCGYSFRKDEDGNYDFSKVRPCCTICWSINSIQNQLDLLKIFVKERSSKLDKKEEKK